MGVVKSNLEAVYKQTDIKDPDEGMDFLSDYSHKAANGFIDEWSKNEGIEEVPQDVRDEVLFKIEENAGNDWWKHQRDWLLQAIEESLEQAQSAVGKRAAGSYGPVHEEKGIVSIKIFKPFLSIWQSAVEGVGYAAWGGDEKLSDLKNAVSVLAILDEIAEVYGLKSVARLYEAAADDNFQPETGRYGELAKVAEKAMKG